MPARRSTGASSSSSQARNSNGDRSPQPNESAYKLKRKKNNEAVQRTREKTKNAAEERKKRITKLKEENIRLTEAIKSEKNHIAVLRDLIIQGKTNAEQDHIVNEILNQTDDDDDDEIAGSK